MNWGYEEKHKTGLRSRSVVHGIKDNGIIGKIIWPKRKSRAKDLSIFIFSESLRKARKHFDVRETKMKKKSTMDIDLAVSYTASDNVCLNVCIYFAFSSRTKKRVSWKNFRNEREMITPQWTFCSNEFFSSRTWDEEREREREREREKKNDFCSRHGIKLEGCCITDPLGRIRYVSSSSRLKCRRNHDEDWGLTSTPFLMWVGWWQGVGGCLEEEWLLRGTVGCWGGWVVV